ncbi:Hypothetical predicted protein [Cloeon dipterum]|uniref:7-dehydrocholesterol reductase n=1 Tax=Cloeon dipterum TaxID=197152 RepID=A0A8S1C9J6_9INSE|nr:Hypothetical predicted protein [Cloeon dipterum]
MAKSQEKSLFETGWYKSLRYNVIPPIFVLIFTAAVQWLALLGDNPCPLDLEQCPRLLGSVYAWILTCSYLLWVFVWLWIPDKKFKGPVSPEGEIPEYQDNGFQFYVATCILFCALQFMNPLLSAIIVDNFPEILACLSIVALLLCVWLCISGRIIKGKVQQGASFVYDFYRGCELHPKFLGCDAKQLTVSRLGMSLWQVLILAAFFVGPKQAPEVVSLALQTIYIAKFFWWENGYYTTLDITYDRAGYYLCWGGSVWIPALFPLSQMAYGYGY